MSHLVALLEQSARAHPDRPAVSDLEETGLNYAELERASRGLAEVLLGKGIGKGDRVALVVPKSVEAVVAIWAILRCGAAYVPIDPNGPVRRAAQIASDCDVAAVLASGTRPKPVAAIREAVSHAFVIQVHGSRALPDAASALALEAQPSRDAAELPELASRDLAYILYTSGSTGTPKGVMISHGASLSFVRWAANETRLHPGDVHSGHAPFHFDLSVFDLFAPVLAGAKLVVLDEETVRFPMAAAAAIEEQGLTVWYSVPGALRAMLQSGRLAERALQTLRVVIFAGESYPAVELHHLQELLSHATLFNWYGPTETNVCTSWPIPRAGSWNEESIPIGPVCEGSQGLVVDEDLQVVAEGELGELLIAGPTLMSGYWGIPDSGALIPDPRDPTKDALFYRTGDLVVCEASGVYRYHGRRDGMVKIRGYRVEVAEVEAALSRCEKLANAAVVPLALESGEVELWGFVVTQEGAELEARSVARELSQDLPSHMIPAQLERLDALPLTSTGKIDRQSLLKRAQAPGSE